MPTLILRIITLIVAGVVIGVSLGAMFCAALPIWLGLSVIAACSYISFEAYNNV